MSAAQLDELCKMFVQSGMSVEELAQLIPAPAAGGAAKGKKGKQAKAVAPAGPTDLESLVMALLLVVALFSGFSSFFVAAALTPLVLASVVLIAQAAAALYPGAAARATDCSRSIT